MPSPDPVEGASGRARLLWQATHVDHWNVGVVRAPIATLLSGEVGDVDWMPHPDEGRLQADPFGVVHDGRRWVLYEALDYAEDRGFLLARELRDEGWGDEVPVLREVYHQSYPYPISLGGEVFLVPERFGAREVAILRAVEFPSRWEHHATLRADFCGIDSTLLWREGLWWCWTTDREQGHDRRLLLFFAERLEGPWHAHPGNPVRIDVRAARCGGTPFEHEGALYRPGQDYSRKNEERITWNRVTELTTQHYCEETVGTLEPLGRGRYPDKLHTVATLGDWTLIDGARERSVLEPAMLRYKLGRIAARLGRRERAVNRTGDRG